MLVYKRVLLKLSGEALAGSNEKGIDLDVIMRISTAIAEMRNLGCDVGVVVGGGNFWRGRDNPKMERTRADHMGMLSTVLNALALADALEKLGAPVRVQTALQILSVAEPYIRGKALRHLEKGRIVIYACGTGNPFFSTDTAAALRAIETGAEIVLKATMVDGVYDKDPKKHPDAVKYDKLTFTEVLANNLGVMDATAASMCRDNKMPVLVFNLEPPANLVAAVEGKKIGTLIVEE